MCRASLAVLLLGVLSLPSFAQAGSAPSGLKALSARNIGPAGMSGRVAAIASGDGGRTIWVGAATGGLWRSTGGGVAWTPVFDDQPVSSIGAIAINPNNPDDVWVGTGEGNPRNSAGVGYGVFRTRDGGRTWSWLGLEKTERITRIILDERDPDVAWVSALGTSWGENHERGVFKTTDAGKTWNHVLFVDGKTGCADLERSPRNPDKLIASTWTHRRWPWHFESGGSGSGIWVSYDGGTSWDRQSEGLPKGDLGRIGIGIAPSRPNVVYALVEAKRSGLYRSDDGGHEWRKVNDEWGVNPRPFYYSDIRIDPTTENRIYRLASSLHVSQDGGKSFQRTGHRVHPDHHALWISDDGETLINGNDGGVAISRDRGATWRFCENLPLAQFYHVATDDDVPFNVYGGLQDNGSWKGPSRVFETGGIRNHHWREVGFGDGFATVPLPGVPGTCYCMSQGGNLMRSRYDLGERRSIRPDGPLGVKLRFAWNAGIALDPFDPAVVYYGSQFVHRSEDRGDSWEMISADLTTNDPEKQRQAQSGGLTLDVTNAENHCTILTIAPSPVARGTIWVGTDDGKVHVTTDGGADWIDVTANIPDLPEATWCPHIEVSKHDAERAYAVFDDHRRSNWTTYVYMTDDLGKTWTSIANTPADVSAARPWGFAHALEEDPVDPDLLWLGTEFGLWCSRDGGANWWKWTHGVPTAPVRAITTHGRDGSLVIGTHGRAAYVIDDVGPLRELRGRITSKGLHLFDPQPTYLAYRRQSDGTRFTGDALHRGENATLGSAKIVAWVAPSRGKMKGTLQVFDRGRLINGKPRRIARKDVSVSTGLSTLTWNLMREGARDPMSSKSDARRSIPATPGDYEIRVTLKGEGGEEVVASASLELRPDPRTPDLDWKPKARAIGALERSYGRLAVALAALRDMTSDLDKVMDHLKGAEDEDLAALRKSALDVDRRANELYENVIPPRNRQGIHDRSASLTSKIGRAARRLQSSWEPPSPSDRIFMRQADAAVRDFVRSVNALIKDHYEPLRASVAGKLPPLLRERKEINAGRR